MSVRADVAELLRAGYGDRTIARQVGVTIPYVTRARAALNLPKARTGFKAADTVEDLFWRRVKPVDGDHYEWTGSRNTNGTPSLGWNGGHYSALRIAYRIANGHDPDGYAFTACTHPGCIAPAHMGDTAHARRPAHHTGGTGPKPKGSRAEVVALLREGMSDKQVATRLRTNPKRVAAIRAEEGLPPTLTEPVPFEERWAAHAATTGDGHMRWTGPRQYNGCPVVTVDGRTCTVRRVAFERHHGRPAVGTVRPGCGADWCVRPEHLEDRPMRQRTHELFTAIFGETA